MCQVIVWMSTQAFIGQFFVQLTSLRSIVGSIGRVGLSVNKKGVDGGPFKVK
jgi:hypothetical protein